MSEVIKQDEGKLKAEQRILKKKEREDENRNNYLEALKRSPRFQRYVVKEIFEATLEEVYSLDMVPVSDDPLKIGNVTMQFKMARAGFKKVIDKLKGKAE